MLRLTVGSRLVVELVFSGLWPRGLRHGTRDVEQAFVEMCLAPFWFLGTGVRLRTTSSQWNVPGRYGPHGELFFFLLKKKNRWSSESCLFQMVLASLIFLIFQAW